MSDMKLEVKGIGDLVRAFKQVDSDIPVGLRKEMLAIATDIVGQVQQKVPWQTGTAARSVRPRASQRGAGIAFGGASAPYYPWLDFGGSVGRKDATGHGTIHRPFVKTGRFVYPTIEDNRQEIDDAAERAVINAAKRAQFKVR